MSGSNEIRSSGQNPPTPSATDPITDLEQAGIFGQRLRPSRLAEASAGSWLWHGYLGAGKLTLLTSQ